MLKKNKLLLIPDRYAHYRKGIFEAIATRYDTTLLAAFTEDAANIPVAEEGLFVKGDNWHPLSDVFLFGVCFWQKGIALHVLKQNFDVLIIWGDVSRITTWLAVVLAKIQRKKVILWTHGLYGNENGLKRRLRLILYGMGDHIFTYGMFAKRLLENAGFKPTGVSVVSNSIASGSSPVNLTHRELRKNVRQDGIIECCFIGRLEKVKSLNMLIDLIAWYQENRSVKLIVHFIGDGAMRDDLLEYSIRRGVRDCVLRHGKIYDLDEIANKIENCVCCIAPGNVGLTAITSLSLGLPVITHSDPVHQMPEYEAIVDGVNGKLFERGNLLSLVQACDQLVKGIQLGQITSDQCVKVVADKFSPTAQMEVVGGALDNL